ncbi:von Willebrand factor type A domain [Mactra antiquata]
MVLSRATADTIFSSNLLVAICNPSCANGGTCVAPDTCSCTIYYEGSRCLQKKSCIGKKIELYLILDSSGSIGRENFELVKTFSQSVVRSLDISTLHTRVGLMTFSRYPMIRIPLDKYKTKQDVVDAIHEIPYVTGITETYAALTLLEQEGFVNARSDAPRVAIIITEGTSRHMTELSAIANKLQNDGVTMFAIGVGDDVTKRELEAIASYAANSHIFQVNNYQKLPSVLLNLTTLTCDVPGHSYSMHSTPRPVLISHTRKDPLFECKDKVADVMFLLDSSNDVGQTHFRSVEHFAMDIINDLDIGENKTQVGVITFNTYPYIRQTLNDSKLHLLNVVNQIPYYSGTRETDRALELLRLEGYHVDRYEAPNVVIIITNGKFHNTFLARRSADAVKQSGIEVFVVGVGSNVNKDELEYMASGSEHVTVVSNFVEFDLSNFEFEVARNVCETCVPDVADVMFVVDSSLSVGKTNFVKVKDFIKQMLGNFDIGLNTTRIGMIVYNTDAKISFNLDEYNNTQDIIDAIDNIKYSSGGTNTAQALELMRTQGFLHDRNVTSNIAFLITDGYSKDKDATRLQAQLAKRENKFVMVVTAIGTHLDFQELTDIASNNAATDESLVYHVNSFDELEAQSLYEILSRVACGAAFTASTFPTTVETSTNETTLTSESPTDQLTTASSSSISSTTPITTPTLPSHPAATSTMIPTSPVSTSTSAATPSLNNSCFDKIDTCIGFGKDVCTDYRPWAMDKCKRYCGFCQGPTTPQGLCVDTIDNCDEYGPYICTTTEFMLWSRDNCARYCQFCGPGPVTATTPTTTTTTETPCLNTIDNCIEFGNNFCTDPSYRGWAESHCAEFCGYCSNYNNYPGQKVDNTICPAWHLPKVCKMVQVEGHCCPLPQCPEGYKLSAEAHN